MPDNYYENLCPFCEQSLLLSYFCEDCHSVFCDECVHFAVADELVCASCGSKEILMENMAALECKECNSRHIASIQKQIQTCPNCSSEHVIEIIEKFDWLRNRFKTIIRNSKQFLNPLMYAADSISIQKEKLIRLREDSVRICHNPRLEMELLQLIKLFQDGKHQIQSKSADFFDHINRNFKTYFDIEKSPPRMIPILEAELESLERTSVDIVSYGTTTNEKLDEKISTIRTKIDFMLSLQRHFMKYISLLGNTMDYNEKPVFAIPGKLTDSNQQNVEHFIKPGMILLTNRKIYFLKEKGFAKKKTHLIVVLSLDTLTRVRVKGLTKRKLILEFDGKKYTFQLMRKNLVQLENYIEQARVFDNNKIDRELLYALKHTSVTIQKFRNALESAIISLLGYKTAILEQNDPFGLETPQQYNFNGINQESDFYPLEDSHHVQQHGPQHGNNYTSSQPSTYSPNNTFQSYQRNIQTKPNQDKLNMLRSIYQKRPPIDSNPLMHPPPVPQYHQEGTVSNPYKEPPYSKEIHSLPPPKGSKKSGFSLHRSPGSILDTVSSVLGDESPYIPQPPEVQQTQEVPEIDVTTLVPAKEFPEKLLRLEEQKNWLQRKIDMLQKRRDQGKISEAAFFRQYENSYKELYRTKQYIKQLKKRNRSL